MKKINNSFKKVNIRAKYIAIISVLLFIVAMIPVYRLTFYARVASDDLWYGGYVKQALTENPSAQGLFAGIKWCISWMWNNWQGTYASALFMSLTGWWGDDAYFVGPILVVTVFIIGNMLLTGVLSKHFLKADIWECIILSVISTITQLELVYTAKPAIYWYNAAVHYTFMHGMLCAMLAGCVAICFTETKSKKRLILITIGTTLASLVAAGGNFSTILTGVVILVPMAFSVILQRNRSALFLIPVYVVYFVGFFLNVLAPGNAVRQGYFEGKGIVESVIMSFGSAFKYLKVFITPVSIFCFLMAIPVMYNCVKRVVQRESFKFRFPLVVSIYSFCIYAAAIFPAWYGLGGEPISRTWNVIKFTLFCLVFINIAYWMGYICQKIKKINEFDNSQFSLYSLLFYVILAIGVLICFNRSSNQAGNYLSYGAYYYVHTGEAYNFASEFDARAQYILSSEEMVIEVEPIHYWPWFLGVDTDEPGNYASWYGKNSISLKQ